MEIESLEIFQFLAQCEPISKLTQEQQKSITQQVEIVYFRRGSEILKPQEVNQWLYIIRSGAVERSEADGSVVAKFAEGDIFGQASLGRGGDIKRRVVAIEDCLLYRIPKEVYDYYIESSPYFEFYFQPKKKKSYNQAHSPSALNLSQLSAKDLLSDKPHLVDHKESVAFCAKKMQQENATYLLITQNENIKGIVTDRAFCTKVVADSLSHESPVGLIMSDKLLTIDEHTSAAEAMLLMARNNIRHLPVLASGEVLGVLTATDLIHRQSNNPIYLINQIHKTNTVEKIAEQAKQLSSTLSQMVRNGHNAKEIAYTISSIGRAINVRLIKLAEQTLGPPPIKYAWIIAGSLARNDQTAHSDQDNGIILDDDYEPEVHGEYFEQLSQFVCDGLNACGYVYCPGDVMATNDKWRQPLRKWKEYFRNWILTPEPKALMYASIFFDLNCIYGESGFLTHLNEMVREIVKGNKIFLNYMAANALHNTPPLGLFRSFVLEKSGSEEKTLNLKKRGVVPITDLARVYALSCGVTAINTQERLLAANEAGALSKTGYMDLLDGFEFLSMVRINHQAKQIENGVEPNNHLSPAELSSLEKRHLKDTFEIIRTYQNALESSYSAGLLR